MRQNVRNILLGILVGGIFLWLAVRNVPLDELTLYMQGISYGWILPYTFTALISHYLRAERWRMLIRRENHETGRITVFAGVMLGYLTNYVVPRLGELTRSVYVSRKENLSGVHLVGTVILERVIDFLIMLILIVIVAFAIVADPVALRALFGQETVEQIRLLTKPANILTGLAATAFLALLMFLSTKLLRQTEAGKPWVDSLLLRFRKLARAFIDGLLAVRHLANWPYFIVLTVLIWFCYVLMSYIPFYAFALHSDYNLGLTEALVITAIASVGVTLPSPGGIGTYHWFVRQGLLILYGVPSTVGFAYAFVTHGVMMAIILIFTPLILLMNLRRS